MSLLNPSNIRINYVKVTKKSNFRVQFEFDSSAQRNAVRKLVSYEMPNAKFSAAYKDARWDGTKTFLTDTDSLPIGLFKALFEDHPLVYNTSWVDISYDQIPLYNHNPKIERRQYQLDTINNIFKHKYGLVNIVMGGGKTLVAAATCSYHLSQAPTNKILFIVYDINILEQTMLSFTSLGLKVSQFGGSVKDLSGDVIVATIQSLNNVKDPKASLKDITFIFLDEAHHGKAKTSKTIIAKIPNAQYRIGLTATPHKENSLDMAELMSVTGPIIYEYGFEDAVADNRISPVKAFFLKRETDYDLKDEIFHRKNYKVIWDTGIRDNKSRNECINTILGSLSNLLQTSHLVYIDRTEHAASIISSMTSKYLSYTTMFGEDDIALRTLKKQDLMTDTYNTMISSVVKEGVDFKISPVIALNASGRRGYISVIQFLGRVTRPNPAFGKFRAYIDMIDSEHPLLKAHSQARIQAIQDAGIEVEICDSIPDLLSSIIKYYKTSK